MSEIHFKNMLWRNKTPGTIKWCFLERILAILDE